VQPLVTNAKLLGIFWRTHVLLVQPLPKHWNPMADTFFKGNEGASTEREEDEVEKAITGTTTCLERYAPQYPLSFPTELPS
jgi:hypothetical protein